MSGYRSLHREQLLPEAAIWHVETSPLLTKASRRSNSWRIWVAASDSLLRSFIVDETSLQEKESSLDASALRLQCTHVLVGALQEYDPTQPPPATTLGCARVSIVRNYTGEDDAAGEFIVLTLEMAGTVRIWKFAEEFDASWDSHENEEPNHPIKAMHEFNVDSATGTTAALCPPRVSGEIGDITAAIGCLDGTIAIVATGIATPKHSKEPSPAGTLVDSWGSRGSSIPLSLCWHPKQGHTLCVGRQDGIIDILTGSRKNQHRLARHKTPVRAVAFTDDGHLLLSGSDSGIILIWDVSRKAPALVHHVMEAHKGWLFDIQGLPDSRRFVTCGADKKVHVWNVGQMHQPVHTFHTDFEVWTLSRGPPNTNGPRLVTGSDDGHVQVYSLEH